MKTFLGFTTGLFSGTFAGMVFMAVRALSFVFAKKASPVMKTERRNEDG